MSTLTRYVLVLLGIVACHVLAAAMAYLFGMSHDAALLRVVLGFVVVMAADEVAA